MMLKILHTGDWHIGSFPGPESADRMPAFRTSAAALIFRRGTRRSTGRTLSSSLATFSIRPAYGRTESPREPDGHIPHPAAFQRGPDRRVARTPNHDSEEQFEMLTTAFYGDDSVGVVTEPEVLHIHTYHGQRVDVACIPGFDRGVHRTAHPGLSREEETQVFTDELAKVVLGLKAQCEPGVTSILSTHFTSRDATWRAARPRYLHSLSPSSTPTP